MIWEKEKVQGGGGWEAASVEAECGEREPRVKLRVGEMLDVWVKRLGKERQQPRWTLPAEGIRWERRKLAGDGLFGAGERAAGTETVSLKEYEGAPVRAVGSRRKHGAVSVRESRWAGEGGEREIGSEVERATPLPVLPSSLHA